MLISEFQMITGIYPTAKLYEAIDKAYMEQTGQARVLPALHGEQGRHGDAHCLRGDAEREPGRD